MTTFLSRPDRVAELDALAASGPEGLPALEPRWYSGALTAAPRGLAASMLDVALYAAEPVGAQADSPTFDARDQRLRQETNAGGPAWKLAQRAVHAVEPDPLTTGIVGQVLFGISRVLPQAIAGGAAGAVGGPVGALAGAAALPTMLQSNAARLRWEEKGVDPATAHLLGAIEGVSAGAGALVPGFMGPVAGRAASAYVGNFVAQGAANAVMGVTSRAAMRATLDANGRDALAEQIHPFDAAELATDFLLGGAFSILGSRYARTEAAAREAAAIPTLTDRMDAARFDGLDESMTVNQAGHAAVDTMPGIPADIAAMNAHADALAESLSALEQGRAPDVAPIVEGAKFDQAPNPLEVPATEAVRELVAEVPEAKPAPTRTALKYDPQAGLSEADRVLERDLGARPFEELQDEYAKLPDSEGGKVLNTDVARELSPAYLKDRTKSAAVHEPASALIKALYAKRLAELRPDANGNPPVVMFTAGGTGAGKTSGLESVPETAAMKAEAALVYDTNMNGYASAKAKIDQALEAGADVAVVLVYRDPVEALTGGALPRAMKQQAKFGSGRTVPLAEHAKTHTGSREVILQLAREYAGNDRVGLTIIDNSRGPKGRQAVPIEFLADKAQNSGELRARLREALDNEREQGRISEAIYRGFLQGEPEAAAGAGQAQESSAGLRGPGGSSNDRSAQQPRPLNAVEDSGKTPPAPGQPFIVYRLGSSGELAGRNGGNALAVALHLARIDDVDAPQARGGTGNTLTAYRVTIEAPFGDYRTINAGSGAADAGVGREALNRGAVNYSFPKGAGFTAEKIGAVPLATVRAALKARGYADFDDAGGANGAAAIREALGIPVAGKADQVKIGEKYEPVTWQLVDANATAAAVGKGENQARDRTRAASEQQVAKIASAIDFNLLAESPVMDFGAPTLAADGRVVGGNGRVLAIQRAYAQGNSAYRDAMTAALERFGIDPTAAEGMAAPMLVRVLPEGVDVRKAALASNEGAGMRMSMLEQAAVDAERLPALDTFHAPEDGNFNTPGNRDFVMAWIGRFPGTEQAALVDAAGALSQEGLVRLRNAILAKAYGDNATLARLVELTDPVGKNVSNALVRAAGPLATGRDAIARGDLHPLDIVPDLLASVEKFAQVKNAGDKVSDFLAQGELLGESLTPESRALLAYMDTHARSAKAIADMLVEYQAALETAGNPKEGDMFGGGVPTKGQLIERAIANAGKGGPDLFDYPGSAAAPRSRDVAAYRANTQVDGAALDGPLHQTAVDCAKAAA